VGWREGEGDESRVHQQPRAPNYDAPPLPAASVASGNVPTYLLSDQKRFSDFDQNLLI